MNKMSRILKAIIQTFSFARRGLSRLVAWPFGLTGMILVRYVPCYRRLPVLAQKLVASLLVLTITITSLYSLSFLFAEKTSAAWFDDSWSYRQRIPIDTHTAAETNVYNEMSVDTATLTTDKLQADCDDLRFTKENGEILPYQIVSGCDTATTVIRVGFDTMPVAPFNIYMYYGNPSATAKSQTLTHTACGSGCAEGTAASEEKAPSPVGYWKFDEGTGTNANDSTPNNNDGDITGATWQTEDQCISGKCLYFDGTDDFVSVADTTSSPLDSSVITVSTWIRANGTQTAYANVIDKAHNGTGFTGW